MRNIRNARRGFTLIEMIVVIVISGILSLFVARFIQAPVESFQSQSRRSGLVDSADTALRRMSRDVRNALPNSIRVGCGGRCIEFLHTLSGGRYRARPISDSNSLSFDPSDSDSAFEVLGFFDNGAQIQTGGSVNACREATAACLVIYNTGTGCTATGVEYSCAAADICSDAYRMGNAATVTGVNLTSPLTVSFDNSGFCSGDSAFPTASPEQRFFVVDTPITYLCDLTQGSIKRYQGYNIRASQSQVDTDIELKGQSNPAEDALLIDNVTACAFNYNAGTLTRNGLLIMEITLTSQGESITLIQQAHVSNMP